MTEERKPKYKPISKEMLLAESGCKTLEEFKEKKKKHIQEMREELRKNIFEERAHDL